MVPHRWVLTVYQRPQDPSVPVCSCFGPFPIKESGARHQTSLTNPSVSHSCFSISSVLNFRRIWWWFWQRRAVTQGLACMMVAVVSICWFCSLWILERNKFWNRVDCQWSEKKIQKHTEGSKERVLIRQNKTGCGFFRKSSFSKLSTIQKQTNHLSFASWILAEGRGHETDMLNQA